MPPIEWLHELVPAVHSPMREDGAIDVTVVPAQAAFLAANGIKTVFITGSTGECLSLTCAERLALYDAWAAAGNDHGLAVIAHVGAHAIEEARLLARRARDLELSAISALAPSYFKPRTIPELIDWCAAIASEAPDLPLYYYDIPAMTGVSLPMDDFLIAAPSQIPSLAGIKYSNPDLVMYRRCLDLAGKRLDLPWGTDEALLGALATGARGAVGSTYNWAPRLYTTLIEAFQRGDLTTARRLQSVSVDMVSAMADIGFMGAAKALLGRLGVAVGPARLPLTNPTPAQVDTLMARLHELGFAEWGAPAR
jgi:N-acetylneuraminate lyase